MTKRTKCCETCKWWHNPRDNGYGSGEMVGNCRRFPPVLVVDKPLDEDDEVHEDPLFWAFPATIQDDFCGEWKPMSVDSEFSA